MALRRSSQSAWVMSSERDLGTKTVAFVAVISLFLGSLLGWAIRGGGDSAATGKGAEAAAQIIDPVVTGLVEAPQTEAGAVKAATSFITGFPTLSIQPSQTRSLQVGQLLAPQANPDVQLRIEGTIAELRSEFLGNQGAEHNPTARAAVTPVTYKSEMQAVDRARVQIWYNTVIVDPKTTHVEMTWSTASVQLVWTDHWRIAAFDTQIGPMPQPWSLNAVISDYKDVVKVFDGFKVFSSAVK